MRLAVDTGGTFTDLVVEGSGGDLRIYKSPTTPQEPVAGILNVLELAAADMRISRNTLLQETNLFIHATTRAINTILTGATAKTAFLTTRGHPDILLFREGGRADTFNQAQVYPPPYVSRALTFEVDERIGADGRVVVALDETSVVNIISDLGKHRVQAVAVCLLWSIANPRHELRIGELLEAHLPGIPYTLSHVLNSTMREYRRASSTAIDASLKPIMSTYLRELEEKLRLNGFSGRLLVVTSAGGVMDAAAISSAPIHAIGSGPAMAPVAGRHYAAVDAQSDVAVVADTGGTSYDVSLVRRGRIPQTRETWLGKQYVGHMTGFPSIDVKSIGAGGGSVAWVDEGGLLHVGPQSAGAEPGPVCYGRGGIQPTVTDACLVLGYLDPDYFLGGSMKLDADAARAVLEREVGAKLGLSTSQAASAVLKVMTEHMVTAIQDITINQGIDPRSAALVAGGGAGGFNAVAIARRLGCPRIVIPQVAAVLSAAGALMSDLSDDFISSFWTTTTAFNFDKVNEILAQLDVRCRDFIEGPGRDSLESHVEFSVEAHYPNQAWELEIPLRVRRFGDKHDVEELEKDFHAMHQDVFAISDPASPVEILAWRGRVSCQLHKGEPGRVVGSTAAGKTQRSRIAYWPEVGDILTDVWVFDDMPPDMRVRGPAIIESPVTTVVVEPGAIAEHKPSGSLVISPYAEDHNAHTVTVEASRR